MIKIYSIKEVIEASNNILNRTKIDSKLSFNKKNKKIIFKKYSNNFIKYRYYLEQDEENIYLITNRGELFYIIKKNLLEDEQIELKKN